jgi:hypothetical protein
MIHKVIKIDIETYKVLNAVKYYLIQKESNFVSYNRIIKESLLKYLEKLETEKEAK